VFEDVEAGLKAGRAAGAEVIAVTAAGHGLDWPNIQTIEDYTNIVPVVSAAGLLSIKRP
jgi:sugar-phosphatase